MKKGISDYIKKLCSVSPVIPVLVVEDVASAKPLARSLLDGGVSIVEVTLRTSAALEVIHEMSKISGLAVAAGTITNAKDLVLAKQAGALFGVTPGTTRSILHAAQDEEFPLLPGVATVSEMLMTAEYGYDFLKFFPAEVAGGIAALKSFAGPLPNTRFCPTGGISRDRTRDYLALENVVCVGGSWLTPPNLVQFGEWGKLTRFVTESLHFLNSDTS